MNTDKPLKSILKKDNKKVFKKYKKNISFSNNVDYKLIPNRFNLNDVSDIALISANLNNKTYFCFEYFIIIFLILILFLYLFNKSKIKKNIINNFIL